MHDAFARWFRQSQVVDNAGKPLVVFHGTSADFEAFDMQRSGASTGHRSAQLGIFFTASPDVAAAFAGERWEGWPLQKTFVAGAQTMPVHLAIENPLVITAREFLARVVRGSEDAGALRDDAIAAGHDGVLIRGDAALAESMGGEEYGADAWVAFRPEQIKSAIANSGLYARNNPDITDRIQAACRNGLATMNNEPTPPIAGLTWKHAMVRLGDLPRDMREELFNEHAMNMDPEATERGFYAKRVRSGTIAIAGLTVANIPSEQLAGYTEPDKWPPIVIADGRLTDGQHRIARARTDGIERLRFIDVTGLIDTDAGGFISELPREKPAVAAVSVTHGDHGQRIEAAHRALEHLALLEPTLTKQSQLSL